MSETPDETALRSVTFKLPPTAVKQLQQITNWRYPGERHKATQTVREIIRETYEREKANREGSGK